MDPAATRVWDTCSLVNLIASRRAAQILKVLNSGARIVREVLAQEVLYVRPLPEEDATVTLRQAQDAVTELRGASLLTVVDLNESETSLFVKLATEIDDGEARTLAIAASRNWCAATDDRPALRTARNLTPPIVTITTPEWVRQWADSSGADVESVKSVVRNIELCARFTAPRNSPQFDWWKAHRPPE